MADQNRKSASALALYKDLEEKSSEFDFFQAIRRLEGIFPDKPRMGQALRAVDDPVRLAQDPSLAFAPSTVSSFEPGKEGQPPRLSVLFLGLFGPNGPLPLHLSEYARDRMRNADDPTFVRFADIFHHRILSLFYRAWASAQPAVSFDRPKSDPFSTYVGSLCGIGMPSFCHRGVMPDLPLLHYAGRFAGQTRNAEGLRDILEDFFDIPVGIEEFIGQWITIPEQDLCRLGESLESGALGVTTTIGDHVWVCQQKFRIVMGPMIYSAYERLLPGGSSLERLNMLVHSYIGDELEWDVRLILIKEEAPPIKLEETGRLGWTSWLSPEYLQEDAGDLLVKP